MAARLYPDCSKRFSWSGCVEWGVLGWLFACWANATYFPIEKIIHTRNLFPYLRKMYSSSFLYSVAALPSICSAYANEVCVFFMIKKASFEEIFVWYVWCSQVFVLWGQAGLHELEIVATSNRVKPKPDPLVKIWSHRRQGWGNTHGTKSTENARPPDEVRLGDSIGCRCKMM